MNAREILDSIKAGLTGITPGEWKAWDRGIGYEVHGEYDEPINIGHRETFTKADASFIAAAPVTVARLTAALELVLTAAEGRAHTLRHTADRLNQQCLDRNPDRDYDAAIRYEHYALEAESTHIRITTLIEKALTD
jgi:hypothetical protein